MSQQKPREFVYPPAQDQVQAINAFSLWFCAGQAPAVLGPALCAMQSQEHVEANLAEQNQRP